MSRGSDAHRNLKRAVAVAIGQLPYARAFIRETGQGWVGGRVERVRTLKGAHVDAVVGATRITFGVPGGADIEVVVAPLGRHIELEVKTGRGKKSRRQRMFGAAIARFGVVYEVVRDVDHALKIVERVNTADLLLTSAAGAGTLGQNRPTEERE